MKTLVIAAHPALDTSRLNRRWLEEIRKYPDRITVSSLYEKYPDSVIDIEAEQALAEAHDRIIFQFPFYWFNCPPLMKQWLDEVLLEGWAFGEGSWLFRGKTIGLAVSTGLRDGDYSPNGDYLHEMNTLLLPFEMTARYLQSGYEKPFIQYGVNSRTSEEELQESAERYARHVLEAQSAEIKVES
ncbi:NAD(P)H-dependent oxidoreductase [Saccharibacillus alkalitolerans]|uniref:NAD(P)H-dependent oxidoreductase n=1 Tax=Saccharibacillus alkalitolerans TaxID=2705290 RepID=A0ABX0F6H5_9BACL|nr:NAD(P)H-dependent oxidoreductase [Saccharibacillus alkalitolerans]NGZ75149.1 NAD(P)H-dependent oxidoreductase [Saccharibacillus alkalitolerans]